MMKLIMFMGGVETLEYFSMEIANYLEEKGYEIFWYNLLVGASETVRLKEYIDANKGEDFVAFTFNHEGIAGEEGLYYDTKDDYNTIHHVIWDESNVKVINMVVDHPLYYHKYHKYLPKNYYQINIDKNHYDYMRLFYPEIKNVSFMLTAGMELNKNGDIIEDCAYLPMDKRDYDIVFTGNFTPKYILQKSIERMGPEYISFYENVLQALIDNPKETVEKIGQEALKNEIEDISLKDMKEAMTTFAYCDLAVRFHYRELIIRALTDMDFKVAVVGDGFDLMQIKKRDNLINLGYGDTRKCLNYISQAKISLNVMPWFKAGAHDRIFTSMLNGAVLLTDSSEYLEENILNDSNSIRYDLETLRKYETSGFDIRLLEDLKSELEDYLTDNEKLSKMANTAYSFAKNRHDWRARAKEIEKVYFT